MTSNWQDMTASEVAELAEKYGAIHIAGITVENYDTVDINHYPGIQPVLDYYKEETR